MGQAVNIAARTCDLFTNRDRLTHAVELGLAMCRQAALLQGFESRLDHAAIGSVTNLASRLCAEADAGQLLVSSQVWADICGRGLAGVPQTCVLKGFARPVRCFRIDGTSQTLLPPRP